MQNTFLMGSFQSIKDLRKELHDFRFGQWFAGSSQSIAQVLTVDVVHDIVGGSVLLKQVMHPDDMLVVEFAQSTRLFLELLQLRSEGFTIIGIADAYRRVVIVTLADTTHEELLDGILFPELYVRCHIRIAKTTR